jgi:hypothetical protein
VKSRDQSAGAYQWLNTGTYAAPHGLGFGGSNMKGGIDNFRLWIPDTLEDCIIRDNDLTYESGNLLPGIDTESSLTTNSKFIPQSEHHFEIDGIEIWAVGGDEIWQSGAEAQKQTRSIQDKNIERARKVDKAQFFNNDFDREFFLAKTLGNDNSANGYDR